MRIGIDIDGVLADMAGASPPAPAGPWPVDFWETLDEVEPGMVRQLAETAAASGWEVCFLTKRPETSGAPAQRQTERWLERHGFPRPSVHIVRGSRGRAVAALGLDMLIDDTLENCVDAALVSKAASFLIWSGDETHARRSLRGLNVDLAPSLGDLLERLTGRPLERSPRVSVPVPSPAAVVHPPAMPISPPAPHPVLTRRTFAVAAIAFAAFAIYGSLVPLEFRPVGFDEALTRFRAIRYLQLGVGSRADFVANILLFIPLGALLAGASLVDRRGWLRSSATVVTLVPLMSALSVAIEFTQVFFPRRTVSLNDILAETVGGAIGVAGWLLLGQTFTNWIRAVARERQRPLLMVRLLSAYAVVFLFAQLMPFDITIDLGELAQKYDEGRIVLIPFGYDHGSAVTAVWDLASDVLLWIPIGVLACIGWTVPGTTRRSPMAIAAGVVVACVIELAQVFVFTRYTDLTDLLTATAGIACGVLVIRVSATPATRIAPRPNDSLWPIGALLLWFVALATYHWAPFDFSISREILREGLAHLWVPPFRNYYFGSEFHAFTEITRKFLLAAPVGVLLRFGTPAAASVHVARLQRLAFLAIGLIVFSSLEAGQMFLPARTADLTDVLIGVSGVEAGRWLVERLRASDAGMTATHPGVVRGHR